MTKRNSRSIALSMAVAATVASAVLLGRSRVSSNQSTSEAAPAVVAILASDAVLGNEIDRIINESTQANARWGVFVSSLRDGRIVYSRNGDKMFTPASNMKVYTTAVALDLLGADYRWRTSAYATKEPDASGTVEGDLVLYGRGAPDLVSSSLTQLADQVYQRGVRTIRGDVVGDESYLRGELYGNGWQWNDIQWYFGAQPSALTVDANSIQLTITSAHKSGEPAQLKLNPETAFVHLTNHTATVDRSEPTTVGINRGLSNNELRVWGEFPAGGRGFSAYLSVANPALWAATTFKKALEARGIKILGEARTRDSRIKESELFDPGRSVELGSIESVTLREIVRETNKESNNLYAELLLRTLGKERGVMAPDPDPRKMKQRGDDEAGSAVVKLWLDRAGVNTRGLMIVDGSGLSRLNLVSPEATVRLLSAISNTNSSAAFRESLPVSGRDGTLKPRLLRESGRIAAKTGSLTFVHSLSGYVTTKSSEVLVFSILCNDATGAGGTVRTIDQIAGLLASFNPAGSANSSTVPSKPLK